MNVIVDTSVWSLALRRHRPSEHPAGRELAELIREGRATILGPIRQELLSGIRREQQFQTLRDHLRAFPDIRLGMEDYEEAASFFNRCRAKGVQGSNTDFLICGAAVRRQFGILTTDGDFESLAKLLPIQLHSPRSSLSG
ncbi:MAG: PIN domain-containing protein [Acidobacteria bacterium]|nr:PIN domain-containing protein [Acidobacteriota bacterium]